MKDLPNEITANNEFLKNTKKSLIKQKAIDYQLNGNLTEAEKYYKLLIDSEYIDHDILSNYSVILKAFGNLNESLSALKRCIELFPDRPEAFSNLGTIYLELNQYNNAEICFKKAIQIKPDFLNPYINLVVLMVDAKRFKDAESILHKALRFHKQSYILFYHLANIYRQIGRTQDAIVLCRQSIKLNPKYLETHILLGKAYQDLNQLDLSNKYLFPLIDRLDIQLEFRLQLFIDLAINSLLRSEIDKLSEYLYSVNQIQLPIYNEKFVNSRSIKIILSYFKFLTSLSRNISTKKSIKQLSMKKFFHVGESHALAFSHSKVCIEGSEKLVQPYLIKGAKAWHFASPGPNRFKYLFDVFINDSQHNGDTIFISFGEIDCRSSEGILAHCRKSNSNLQDAIKNTLNNYLEFIENRLINLYPNRYYFGVPAPSVENDVPLDQARIDMIKNFNLQFKLSVLARSAYFVDVYRLTANEDGINNNQYICDGVHLKYDAIQLLLQKYLVKKV